MTFENQVGLSFYISSDPSYPSTPPSLSLSLMDLLDIFFSLTFTILTVLWWRHCSKSTRSVSPATKTTTSTLPPGPPGWPLVGNLFQVILARKPFIYIVRDLRTTYGPIFTMRMGQRTLIIVTSSDLIHEALVQKGPLFASRPRDSPTRLIFSADKCTINSAPYGALWRGLRRNFVTELVTPARVRQFGWIRDWAFGNHLGRLREEFRVKGAVVVMDQCRLTVCSILVNICFGARVPEDHVREIESVLKDIMMMTTPKLPDFLPIFTPLFRGQLGAARKLRRRQMDCLVPLIRARRAFIESNGKSEISSGLEMVSGVGEAYVDSLFALQPPGHGPLGEEEIVALCSEVMSAGTDTSATALEWSLLHLVLDQAAQQRLYDEVVGVVGDRKVKITEEDVEKMAYMQAVVKETLRRHPPSHFVLSHAATKETELGGYRVPADASVEFYTAWVTEDPGVWGKPDEWRPERFEEGGEGVEVDLTGGRGVRMMPFGAGRRICPAATLGMLHVQLMLANMVREFKWVAVEGEKPPEVEEKFAFTVVMKEPLRAAILERE